MLNKLFKFIFFFATFASPLAFGIEKKPALDCAHYLETTNQIQRLAQLAKEIGEPMSQDYWGYWDEVPRNIEFLKPHGLEIAIARLLYVFAVQTEDRDPGQHWRIVYTRAQMLLRFNMMLERFYQDHGYTRSANLAVLETAKNTLAQNLMRQRHDVTADEKLHDLKLRLKTSIENLAANVDSLKQVKQSAQEAAVAVQLLSFVEQAKKILGVGI